MSENAHKRGTMIDADFQETFVSEKFNDFAVLVHSFNSVVIFEYRDKNLTTFWIPKMQIHVDDMNAAEKIIKRKQT